jgi:hypothetical protein
MVLRGPENLFFGLTYCEGPSLLFIYLQNNQAQYGISSDIEEKALVFC